MTLKSGLILFVCVFAVFVYNISASQGGKEIEIISEFETIIETNDNYTVFCQGKKPLEWEVPEVTGNKKSWTTFINETEQLIGQYHEYKSRLTIINMTYPFVGFYHCHYTHNEKNNETKSAKIYLYVNDNEHLSTLEEDSTPEIVVVTQYQEALLPCKPTSPDVNVSLSLAVGEDVRRTIGISQLFGDQ